MSENGSVYTVHRTLLRFGCEVPLTGSCVNGLAPSWRPVWGNGKDRLFQMLSIRQALHGAQPVCTLLISGTEHITNIILILLLLFLSCFFFSHEELGGALISLATQAKILGIIFDFFIRFTPSIPSFFRRWLHVFSMKPSCPPFPSQPKPLNLRLKQWLPKKLGSSVLPSADPLSPHHQRRNRPRHSPASNPNMASYWNPI